VIPPLTTSSPSDSNSTGHWWTRRTHHDRNTTWGPWTRRPPHDRNTTREHRFTWPGWFTETPETESTHTTVEPKPEDECPRVPQARRGPIDLSLIEGQLLFEVARIQTYNSPGSINGVSCAVAKLYTTDANGTRASIKTSWEEGWLWRRSQKSSEGSLLTSLSLSL